MLPPRTLDDIEPPIVADDRRIGTTPDNDVARGHQSRFFGLNDLEKLPDNMLQTIAGSNSNDVRKRRRIPSDGDLIYSVPDRQNYVSGTGEVPLNESVELP